MIYQADLAGVSLKVPAAELIAELLIEGISAEGWMQKIQRESILQQGNMTTFKGQANAIGVDPLRRYLKRLG